MSKHERSLADATRCVHAGEDRHGRKASITTDIVQTSVFVVPEVEELRRYAAGKSDAYLYTRYGNPTVRAAEEKIAALEGGEDCIITASGMSAELVAVLTACSAGDEVLAMADLYGGTVKLFENFLPKFGIGYQSVPFHELGRIDRYFTKKTKLLFLESPTNPTVRCVDLAELSRTGRKHGACVVVDNTFATPILQKPLALGADLCVHSATKYLGGHSDVTAGALVGAKKWIDEARKVRTVTGGTLDPNSAYLLIRGLKTLDLRVKCACDNATKIAMALVENDRVERVMYPGLPGDPGGEIARKQMNGPGMIVSFDIRGGGRKAERFMDRLKLWYLAPSLGGVESTVSYPVLTSHIGLDPKLLKMLDVSAATIRLSVGIESSDDLIADLEQALD